MNPSETERQSESVGRAIGEAIGKPLADDRIAALEAENAELRAELDRLREALQYVYDNVSSDSPEMWKIATDALAAADRRTEDGADER